MMPSTAPTGTLLPSAALISPSVPATGAGISSVTLSVSSSTTGSSRATASPGCFSQRATVASVIDSPRVGTRISAGIGSRRQRVADEPGLLALVPLEDAGRGRCGLGTAGEARPFGGNVETRQHPLDAAVHEVPGAHILRLLLAPDDLGVAVALQHLAK